MNPLIKSKSVPEKRALGMVLKGKKPINLLNNNYNNMLRIRR